MAHPERGFGKSDPKCHAARTIVGLANCVRLRYRCISTHKPYSLISLSCLNPTDERVVRVLCTIMSVCFSLFIVFVLDFCGLSREISRLA